MVTNINKSLLLVGEDCSGVINASFAGAEICTYTCKEREKSGCNEDSAALIPCGNSAGVLVIADGLGGVAGGDKASATMIRELDVTISNQPDPALLRDSILNSIESANRKILDMGTGSATTILVVEVNNGGVRSYHAGDSMVLVTGQRGKLKYQTISHSPIGYALESGFMESNEAMTHDERHLISNVAGSADMRLELGSLVSLARHDTVLLGSDGLYDNLTIEEIVDIIRCGLLEHCAHELVRLCTERMSAKTDSELCKPDDMTFILYRLK